MQFDPHVALARLAHSLTLVLVGVALSACSDSGGGATETLGGGGFSVVASTSVIAEFAAEIAGDDATVTFLIPAGVDPHAFEPATDAGREIAGANLILVNGYGLEGGILNVIERNRRAGVPVVVVSEGIEPIGGRVDGSDLDRDEDRAGALDDLATADGDPHMWLDPLNARQYALNIAAAMAAMDPERADAYRERGAAAGERLAALAMEVSGLLDSIPASRRKIVVFHDSFGYFARAFGFELSASILPLGSGQEPSAGAIADVIERVRDEAVPAVYREPQFASGTLELVADESGARVLTLYSVPVDGEIESYEELMRANARALIDGLGQ